MIVPRLFIRPETRKQRDWANAWTFTGPVSVSLSVSEEEYFFDGNGRHEDFTVIAPVFKLVIENMGELQFTPPTMVVIRLGRDDSSSEDLDVPVPQLEPGAGLVRNFSNRYAPRITDIALVGWLSDLSEPIPDWYGLPANVELLEDGQARPG
jgi:hypothetical protein